MKRKVFSLLKITSLVYLPAGIVLLILSIYSWTSGSWFAAGAASDVMIKMRALLLILGSAAAILCGILGLISSAHEKPSVQCMAIGLLLLLIEATIFLINILTKTFRLTATLGTLAALILGILYLVGVLKNGQN
ncbi:MAG: hypothetical protein PHG16_08430 [Lachnospiraceae bacterium]|nr:hypothetical protein [Lachnospiraceae bacterium]